MDDAAFAGTQAVYEEYQNGVFDNVPWEDLLDKIAEMIERLCPE